MADFYWKRHDTAPQIQVQLLDSKGNPVDVTGASVNFIMITTGGTGSPKVNAGATVIDAPNGIVGYTPIGANTDTAGAYQAEWQVTFLSGNKETFPNPGYDTVTITADLDNA